jgi:fructose-1,6-bisphosphatase
MVETAQRSYDNAKNIKKRIDDLNNELSNAKKSIKNAINDYLSKARQAITDNTNAYNSKHQALTQYINNTIKPTVAAINSSYNNISNINTQFVKSNNDLSTLLKTMSSDPLCGSNSFPTPTITQPPNNSSFKTMAPYQDPKYTPAPIPTFPNVKI